MLNMTDPREEAIASRNGSTKERLTWRERVLVEMDRQHTSTKRVVAEAKKRGLKISVGTMAEAMTDKMPPNDRVVAAYSIVLGIHPDKLGFARWELTELGYLAYEAAVERPAPQ